MIIQSINIPVVGEDTNSPIFGGHNLVTIANLFATNQDVDHPLVNAANPSTNLFYQTSALIETGVIVDTSGYGSPIDYVAIARHNFGTAKVPVTVAIQNEDLSYSLVEATFTPTDDTPLIFRWAPQICRQVLITLGEPDTTIKAKFAVVYTGKLLVSQRRVYVGHTPITMGRSYQVANNISENGNFLGRIITQEMVGTSVKISNLTPGWYRAAFDPFLKSVSAKPFFFAWRPVTYPTEVGYVWLTSDPTPVNARSNGMMDVELQFRGILS